MNFAAVITNPTTWSVRLGCFGDLIRAHVRNGQIASRLSRGDRVLLRTSRGVELAEAVAPLRSPLIERDATEDQERTASDPLPEILRPTTAQDEWLLNRLSRHRREAVEACRDAIASAGVPATLLDVDHLFDGGTLLLHFLGTVPREIDSIVGDIVRSYEDVVRTADFARLLETGCGEGCGTARAGETSGCTGGCVSCAVRDVCEP